MGILALAGGNEFRPNCVKMDRRILELITLPSRAPRVIIIPAAAIHGSPRMAAENGVRYFKSLGAHAESVMIITHEDANHSELVTPVDQADMIYLAGGDPGHLLNVLRNSALWSAMLRLYQRGGIIAGSSAGAMVLSASMRVWNKGEWVDGLGLARSIAVLVHHTPDASRPSNTQPPHPDQTLIGIPEATAILSADGQLWEVSGTTPVSVYNSPGATLVDHGHTFTVR